MNVKVKICGVTLPAQAREIARQGADFVGCVIEFPKSPRSVTGEKAREIQEAVNNRCRGRKFSARTVGVVVNLPFERLCRLIEESGISIWQLHGNETTAYVNRLRKRGVIIWKAVTRQNYLHYASVVEVLLVDAKNPMHGAGGSGKRADWNFARELVEAGYEVVLSGGLTPENIHDGIKFTRSRIIDASGGVEVKPGVKDMRKVRLFIKNAK
ncbi:MAG: phosphoribosylanthranilate isomerase [Patescibacteria group bacterium]